MTATSAAAGISPSRPDDHVLISYERLIRDCVRDRTLFTRADGIERLWEISASLLEQPPKPLPYAQGSWGPEAIEQLVAPYHWHLPYPDPARG